MSNEMGVEVLWKMITARDQTLAQAHKLSQISLLKKEQEIHAKEAEIHEKESEIFELKRCAEERLQIIDQLRESYYYRLGFVLLEPAFSLKRFIQSWRK